MPTPQEEYLTHWSSARSRSYKIKNLQGQRFGKLLVLSYSGISPASRQSVWVCKCDCGEGYVAKGPALVSGETSSCLCCAKAKNTKVKNLQGERFGKLLVISRSSNNKQQGATWLCRCDCDRDGKKIVVVSGAMLLAGKTLSCGCFRLEQLLLKVTKHGQTKGHKMTRTYKTWAAMIDRVTNPNNKNWKHYGGRGITVCERWKDFSNFFEDMGRRPPKLTLDRTNNERGYEPGNCRYTDMGTQVRNQRIRSTNKTGVSGVHERGNRYRAEAVVDGKTVYRGTFPLSSEGLRAAAEAVKKARQLAEILL